MVKIEALRKGHQGKIQRIQVRKISSAAELSNQTLINFIVMIFSPVLSKNYVSILRADLYF